MREKKGKALTCRLVAAIRVEAGSISISFTFFPVWQAGWAVCCLTYLSTQTPDVSRTDFGFLLGTWVPRLIVSSWSSKSLAGWPLPPAQWMSALPILGVCRWRSGVTCLSDLRSCMTSKDLASSRAWSPWRTSASCARINKTESCLRSPRLREWWPWRSSRSFRRCFRFDLVE